MDMLLLPGVTTTKRKLIGYEIHGKLRLTENAVCRRLASWMSKVSQLKSEPPNWQPQDSQEFLFLIL